MSGLLLIIAVNTIISTINIIILSSCKIVSITRDGVKLVIHYYTLTTGLTQTHSLFNHTFELVLAYGIKLEYLIVFLLNNVAASLHMVLNTDF